MYAPETPVDNFRPIEGSDSATLDSTDSAPVDSTPVDSTPVDSDPPPEPLPLCINEFMADNESVLIAEDGSTPDWIELHNPTDEYIALSGWAISDDIDEELPHVLGDVYVAAGGFTLLYADGLTDSGDDHMPFALSSDGGDVAIWHPDGRGQIIHYGHVESDFSVSRVSDCCSGEGCLDFVFRGTPGETNDTLVETEVFPLGSTWSWWDAGEAPFGWSGTDYDASEWSTGEGDFGFGEPTRTTTVASGPEGDRTPTIYFRRLVELGEVEGGSIDLNVDDGALVWVNGEEAVRVNLPEGEVSHLTWAVEAVDDAAESAISTYSLPDGSLVEGENVIAVEVHQAAATSSDLGFDLGLSTLGWRQPE